MRASSAWTSVPMPSPRGRSTWWTKIWHGQSWETHGKTPLSNRKGVKKPEANQTGKEKHVDLFEMLSICSKRQILGSLLTCRPESLRVYPGWPCRLAPMPMDGQWATLTPANHTWATTAIEPLLIVDDCCTGDVTWKRMENAQRIKGHVPFHSTTVPTHGLSVTRSPRSWDGKSLEIYSI